jgi:hypothetical protein
MSYCGLTAALKSSAGKQQRGPISKQRNHWLQSTLIEAAKLAPRWNPQLAALHARELERGHRNRATLAVARKLVTYLLAVDKSGQSFQLRAPCPRKRSRKWRKNQNRLRRKNFRTTGDRPAVPRQLRGLGRGVSTPDAPYRLYRGRPANPNSYFVDRTHARFPQMDVWPGCRFGRTQRSLVVVANLIAPSTLRELHSSKCQETSVSS